MSRPRKLPPVWVLGLTNATFGMFGGFSVVTLPEMLARQGLPGGHIAAIVATITSPAFWAFLVAPMLDVRLSRRTYALVFAAIAAGAGAFTITYRTHLALIQAAMILGFLAASLVQGAVGGWVGSLLRERDDSGLGAWFAVSNIGSGGIMMLVSGELIAHLRPALAGGLVAAMLLLPSLLYVFIPAPPPDRRLAAESFRQFFGEIAALARRREVVVALVLFLLPSASFALTNVLGGIGRDFSTSERMVSLLGGVGSGLAGITGSLLLPPLAKRFALRPLYLGIGVAGGLFSLSLLLLAHTPLAFAIAITGENGFQALAFAAGNAIAFETIGPGNPLAATQFTLLNAAVNLPIIYMALIDGRAYGWRGINASFLVDASISIVVCLLLGWGLAALRRRASTPLPASAG